MFCQKCGAKNLDTDKFCADCGAGLQGSQESSGGGAIPKTQTTPKAQATQQSNKQICMACKGKGKKFSLRFIISIIVALIIPILGLSWGTFEAVPFAMIGVIVWGVKGRKCTVCGGTGMLTLK